MCFLPVACINIIRWSLLKWAGKLAFSPSYANSIIYYSVPGSLCQVCRDRKEQERFPLPSGRSQFEVSSFKEDSHAHTLYSITSTEISKNVILQEDPEGAFHQAGGWRKVSQRR